MKLIDKMIWQGNRIFRWRSYLPFAAFPLAVLFYLQGGSFAANLGAGARNGWDLLCIVIAFTGLAIRVATVGCVPSFTSGRNTHEQRASVLNKTGLYSVVRHPLYLANFLVFLGFCLALKSIAFAAIAILAFILYYERIILAEEQFLEASFGDEYREWASGTPAVIPQPQLWTRPELAFSWRTALLREYHGVLLIGAVFFALRLIEGLVAQGLSMRAVLDESSMHVWLFGVTAVFYAIAYVLRKHTNYLAAFGRGP